MLYSYDRSKLASPIEHSLNEGYAALVRDKDVEGLLKAEREFVQEFRAYIRKLDALILTLAKAQGDLGEILPPMGIIVPLSKIQGEGGAGLVRTLHFYKETRIEAVTLARYAEGWFTKTILAIDPSKSRVMFEWPTVW